MYNFRYVRVSARYFHLTYVAL